MYTFNVKIVQIRSVCGEICQICTEKWGSRHEKLSMRLITGKPHDQVQTKIQSTAGLWVSSLELASHGAHAQSIFYYTLFFGSVSPLWQLLQFFEQDLLGILALMLFLLACLCVSSDIGVNKTE